MNTREPFDLAKMAITALLMCLVLGATMGLVYYMYDKTEERIDSMEKAATSASMEKLYELEQQFLNNMTNPDMQPLVTNVVAALTEFQNDDLLYVTVTTPDSNTTTYTYTGITLTVAGNIETSAIPVTDASRALLPYSHCRCQLYLMRVDPTTGATVTTGGMVGVRVIPVETSLGGV